MRCPMKSHQEAAVLMDYCSGRLAEDAAPDLELHLAECAACAEWVSAQKALWSVLNEWQAPPASAGFDRSLERRMWQTGDPSWLDRLRAVVWPARPALGHSALGRPVLALATLCLVMVASLLLQNPWTQPPPESQVRTEKIEPEQVERTLDDMQMLRELGLALKPEAATPKTL